MGKIRKLRGGWGWGKMSPGWENRFFRLFQGLASGVVIVDTAFSVGFFCLLVCLSRILVFLLSLLCLLQQLVFSDTLFLLKELLHFTH
jgi:hypothetical protein